MTQPPSVAMPAIPDVLTELDVALESTRAALRLGTIRSTPVRLYTLGTEGKAYAVELEDHKTLVIEPDGPVVSLFQSVQAASDHYLSTPLVLRRLQPALAARAQQTIEPLNRRETELVVLLSRGHANKEIASRLNLAESTVKNRLSTLFARFGAHSRAEMIATAAALGLLTEGDTIASEIGILRLAS